MEIFIPILLILLILALRFFKADIKGFVGEKTTSSVLFFLNKSKYKVLNDVILKSGGYTTQIDHIVISDFGIFVIETKNYKGWIVGSENAEFWTQVIYRRKEKLYNPIRQNFGHIKALKNCLHEYPNVVYKSIIVFPSKADIKVNTTTDVIYLQNLLETIRKYSQINLSETDKENIYNKISSLNLAETFNKRKHVKAIKQRIQKRENAINANKCPRCGNDLIMRNGKYGNFLGCKSYPYCKFLRNV